MKFFRINRSDGNFLIKPSCEMLLRPTYIYHKNGNIDIEISISGENELSEKKIRKLWL